MRKNNSVNRLLHSVSTNNTKSLKNLMNSPNYGKQQIILQSCCFFDYEKSHTPHTSHQKINYIDKSGKKRTDSARISYSKNIKNYKNIYLQTKMNLDKIKSKIDGIQNNNDEYTSSAEKLKNENKALKDTINNLVIQLDKVFYIAEAAKNNEMNIIEANKNNKQEIKEMKNRISSLTIENEELLKQIKEQELYSKNLTINSNNIKNNNNNNKKQIIIDNNKLKRNVSDTNFLHYRRNNNKNINRSIIESNDINNNNKYTEDINKINEDISIELFKEKDYKIENLSKENYMLKQTIKDLKTKNEKNDIEKNKKIKLLERVNIQNIDLSNKLLEADNKIEEYSKKYDEIYKNYNELKNKYQKQDKLYGDINNKNRIYINKNKYKKKYDNKQNDKNYNSIINVTDNLNDYDNNNLQEKYDSLLKEKNILKLSFNGLLNEYNKKKNGISDDIDKSKMTKLKEDNNEYINDALLSKNYFDLKNKYITMQTEYLEIKNKATSLESINMELNKKLENLNTNYSNINNKYNDLNEKYNKLVNEQRRSENLRKNEINTNNIYKKRNFQKSKNTNENEDLKYDLLMSDYCKLKIEHQILIDNYNNKMPNNPINELNKKYDNLLNEYNIKNITYNNLKSKYDDLLKINNNNIYLLNNNKNKLQEMIIENNRINNEYKKKEIEVKEKETEISQFKKIIND